VDFSADPAAAAAYQKDQRNKRKIREATQKLELNIINPLREWLVLIGIARQYPLSCFSKGLLVLDIDYTIVDTKPLTSGTVGYTLSRPNLHGKYYQLR
jgi:ubiquitin-like domain-containing CTD phosphatase 1